MANKQSVLGRGLGALLQGEDLLDPAATASAGGILDIALDAIAPNPEQPRIDLDEESLQALAQSIAEFGVIQPVAVRSLADGQFELVCGHRRVRAAQAAGLIRIPAYVIEAENEQRLAMALIENLQRADLNPIEVALGYQRLMEAHGLTHSDVSSRVGKSRTTVTNSLRLLKLPAAVQVALRGGKLTTGHARPLLALKNETDQLRVLDEILQRELSVRQVEARIKRMLAGPGKSEPVDRRQRLAQKELEDRLRRHLETKVSLQGNPAGKGRIVVHYHSVRELNRVTDLLLGGSK